MVPPMPVGTSVCGSQVRSRAATQFDESNINGGSNKNRFIIQELKQSHICPLLSDQ